ncbi:MAG: T9SS type A sorting domain-containing protein [Flavobacteriales bacterium]|nr:T9SS type A sorting domain-containing protein [Flavobacteriales bacterium]
MKRSIPTLALSILFGAACSSTVYSQCAIGEVEVTIDVMTDAFGYETYWELLPSGNACGTGTIFAGGNTAVGCNGAGAQTQTPGGYGDNLTISEGPWCFVDGSQYDIFWADDYGDDGLDFEVFVNGISAGQFDGTGEGQTFTFTASIPPARDMAITTITAAKYVFENANVMVSGHIQSLGADVVTSFDLNYRINSGAVVTENVSPVFMNAGDIILFEHGTPLTPSGVGANTLTVWASNINGDTDLVPANDELSSELIVNAAIPNIIDQYLIGVPTIQVVAGAGDGLNIPRDLDFHKDLARNELWVVNKDTEESGSSTVTFMDVNAPVIQSQMLEDQNNWHFMSLTTGLAMSDNGNFATSPGVYDANHNGGDAFTGPSLWSSDLAVYAQPSGGNGSHLDMLHQNPESQGIAHESLNRFWVTDGYNGDVTMNDFRNDHGPGADDHVDGIIKRYQEFSITKDPNDHIVSHLVLDKPTGLLYVVDHGAQRVMRIDINTGTTGPAPTWPPAGAYENYAEYRTVVNYDWDEVISTGLVEPAGIDVIGDRLLVSDHSNGATIIYDISAMPIVELGRIQTNMPGIMGIVVGPNGKIWAVNATTSQLLMIEPDAFAGIPERTTTQQLNAYPNPATDRVQVSLENYTGGTVRFDLLDAAGRLVQTVTTTNSSHTLSVAGLPAGPYQLRATLADGQLMHHRLMVTR